MHECIFQYYQKQLSQYDFESRLNYPPTQTASQRLNLETSTALFILLCLLQVFTSLPNSNSTKLITIFVPCLMNACRLCRVSVTSSQGCRLPNTTSELSSFRLSIKPEIFCTWKPLLLSADLCSNFQAPSSLLIRTIVFSFFCCFTWPKWDVPHTNAFPNVCTRQDGTCAPVFLFVSNVRIWFWSQKLNQLYIFCKNNAPNSNFTSHLHLHLRPNTSYWRNI